LAAFAADDQALLESAPGKAHRLRLSGEWTAAHADDLEALVDRTAKTLAGRNVTLDLAEVSRVDTVGAHLLDRLRREIAGYGGKTVMEGGRPEQRILIDAISHDLVREPVPPQPRRVNPAVALVADIGRGMENAWKDLASWVSFLGAILVSAGNGLRRPSSFRLTSFVHHLELVGLRAVPIVCLISFLVGGIIAQQSIFQLRYFGATIFAADLISVLAVRELGVLLAAIMIAGRSGSAFTAEIGSMKMREEIDAIRVMALDEIEVLVLPRMLAIIVALTLLTFLSTMACLAGAALVSLIYGGISVEVFIGRVNVMMTLDSFLVGMIKAPFMAGVIGLIATIEGMQVEGSAESLGIHTTASVVKSIFMVIVLDGLFAMFFSAINM
jgi:phospholipid/cholesterol/gamma-HCH transport system permease protein